MADKKISELDVASPLSGTELVPIVQGGVTRRTTTQAIGDLGGGGGGGGTITGAFLLTGVVTPATIGGGQTDNYLAGIGGVSRANISSSADANITGLQEGVEGKVIILTNIGSFFITLNSENASSTAANRFVGNGDTILPPNTSAMFLYVGAVSRWSKVGV